MKLTKLEMEVMDVVWRLGNASVRDVLDDLAAERSLAYTTVQTIVDRLEKKNALRRSRKIGNAFIFEPLITRGSAHRRAVDELLAFFGGSAQPLLSTLVETGRLTHEDLRLVEEELARTQAASTKSVVGPHSSAPEPRSESRSKVPSRRRR